MSKSRKKYGDIVYDKILENQRRKRREKYLEEQGNKCPGCLTHFSKNLPYTVDHFIPLSRGGSNGPDNIQLLCGSCNYSKQDKFWKEWMSG